VRKVIGDAMIERMASPLQPAPAALLRSALGPHLRPRRFAPGEMLWSEGDTTGFLVALEGGRVRVYRRLSNERSVTLYVFGPGDVFGFLPLIDGEPYPACAEALDDVEAQVLTRTQLEMAAREDPRVALTLLSVLGRRLREAFAAIERLATPGGVPRVAASLAAMLAQGAGGPTPVLALPVSSAEFARALGLTPETLSRAVGRLVRAGVLRKLGRGRFQVLDPAALRRAAAAPLLAAE